MGKLDNVPLRGKTQINTKMAGTAWQDPQTQQMIGNLLGTALSKIGSGKRADADRIRLQNEAKRIELEKQRLYGMMSSKSGRTSSPEKSNTGIIIGSVIGGVAVLGVVLILVLKK